MGKIKTIYLDMDGVLADFVGGACAFHRKENPYDTDFEKWKGDIGGIPAAWGMSTDEFWRPIERSHDFWASLQLLPGADNLYKKSVGLVGMENVHILSSHGGLRNCLDGKMDWLKQYFPKTHALHNYHFAVKKWHYANYDRLLIDDQNDNVNAFTSPVTVKTPGQAILVPRAWNQDYALRYVSANTVLNKMDALTYE